MDGSIRNPTHGDRDVGKVGSPSQTGFHIVRVSEDDVVPRSTWTVDTTGGGRPAPFVRDDALGQG